MHSRSYIFLGIVLFLTALAGFLYRLKPYNWGLDIRGGVQLTYQMLDHNGKPLSLKDAADARDRTITIIDRRATKIGGVSDAVIEPKGTDQIIVQLPGAKNLDEAINDIGTSAQILFYDAKNVVTTTASYRDYTERENTSTPTTNPEVDFVSTLDHKVITPKDPNNPAGVNPAYADVIKGWGEPICGGADLIDAAMERKPDGTYEPTMSFSSDGADKMTKWSTANNHSGEMLAAVLDGVCISIAPIKDGAVLADQIVTEGNFDTTYVRNLVDLLKSGALPVTLKVLSSSKLDPTIGNDALNVIVTAGLVAFIAISLFMLVYYEFPGIIAVAALLLYILFTLTALKLIEATFSLAAIAGFVLSVGMAVDANILVFERLKEEMRSGKDLHRAMDLGFRRALPAIVDSNACTILTALVLLNFGTGPVKGFATTLIIGVAISLFTAVSVTRSLLFFSVGSGLVQNPKRFGLGHQWFGESLEADAHKQPLQIVNKAGRYFLLSALTIVPGVIFWAMGGLKGNVEFTGGTQATYNIDASVTSQQIIQNLTKAGLEGCSVTMGSSGNQRLAYITIPPNKQINEDTKNAAAIIAQDAGLPPQPDAAIDHVGGAVQKETLTNAIYGIICSTILIILYLSIRFGIAVGGFFTGMRFASSAILALIHDILVVIGLAAVMGYLANWQVSALFISAMLTVIGFSTHDTIVIFDRIRENLHRPIQGEDVGNLINRSITQSVARSINTSMTVIVTLAILIAIGSATPELKLFNAAMMVGIISGTYSSIFNASPILYLWDKAIGRKNPKKTLLGIAAENRVRLRSPLQEARPTGPSPAQQQPAQATPGYSQVKRRRASDVERSKRSLSDDDDL